jgi:glycerophosphoryl diester phosphodiesterase
MTTLSLPGRRKPYVMAHRGNRALCPENTLASFRQALADGTDLIETDLHLSADGVFMCIHDATVDRTTDGSGAVAEKTLAELKQLSASYGRAGFENERIPTLSEFAQILPPDIGMALELKTDRFLEPAVCQRLAKDLEDLGVRGRSAVLSFSQGRLQAMANAAPDIPTGWITLKSAIPLKNVQLLGPFFPLLLLNPFYVWWAHRRNQVVCPLDPAPDKRLWLYSLLGCDAILTDDPGATVQRLKKYRQARN